MTTISLTRQRPNSYIEHDLVLLLMAGFLAVDSMVGIIEIYLGVHFKASLIYKTPVLLVILIILGMRNLRFFSHIMLAFVLLMIGPVITMITHADSKGFINDFTYMLKLCSPLIYFQYFMLAFKELPHRMTRFTPIVLKVNYAVLLLNIGVGIFGFGYASYTSSEGSVGVNGFFGAGNELGAVFVVLSAYFLANAYQHSTFRYICVSLITVVIGALISTKTSILAAMALVFLLPVFVQGKRYFVPTPLKVIASMIIFVGGAVAIYSAIDILQQAGLWKRVVWIYEEHGLLTVIFSSRNEYAADLFALFREGSLHTWMFGLTSSALYNNWVPLKPSAEIDPVDTLVTFGFIGLAVALMIYFKLLSIAIKSAGDMPCPQTRASLLAFLLLCGLSFFSGHIWFSGMLGPFLGLILANSAATAQGTKQPTSLST